MRILNFRQNSTTLWTGLLAAVLLAAALVWQSGGQGSSADANLDSAVLHVFEDVDGGVDLAGARAAFAAGRFEPISAALTGELNFGYRRSAVWLHIALPRALDAPSKWLLEVAFPTLDRIEVFHSDPSERVVVQRSGDLRPFGERPWPHRNHVFPLEFGERTQLEVFVRVESEGSLTIPLALVTPQALQHRDQRAYAADAVYFGMLLGLLLFNLLLWLSLREAMYIRYVAFVFSIGTAFAAQNGFGAQFLWPELPHWGNVAYPVGMAAAGMFGALFARSFLETRRMMPLLDRLVVATIAAFALSIAAPWLFGYRAAAILTSLSGLSFAVLAVGCGIRGLLRGHAGARYFLLAWLILLVGVAVMAMRNFDWLPTTWLTTHAMQIGSALEMLLLSFAMADRINVLRQEREAARQAMLDAARVSEQQLERRVVERTVELEAANQRLRESESALQRLAFHDPLTGLGNRIMLSDRLQHAIDRATRHRTRLAVLLVDLDGFKGVNDRYGHAVGDMVLVAAAHRMHGMIRASDTFVRLGGDEFVIIVEPIASAADAFSVADKLIAALAEPLDDGVHQHRIGASVGVALYPEDGVEGDALVRAADGAMYRVKAAGKSHWSRAEESSPG